MIDPKELRIGNLLKTPDSNLKFKVAEIHLCPNGQYKVIDERSIHQISWKGIELTEEWLLKFGAFTICETVSYSIVLSTGQGQELLLEWSANEWNAAIIKGDHEKPEYDIHIRELDCVHRLQNLYFALTGKELTIKQSTPYNTINRRIN